MNPAKPKEAPIPFAESGLIDKTPHAACDWCGGGVAMASGARCTR